MKTLFRRKNITDSSNCCITVSEYIVNTTSHLIDSLIDSFSTYVPRELEQFFIGSACRPTLNCSSVIFACDVGTLINTYLFQSLQWRKLSLIKKRFEVFLEKAFASKSAEFDFKVIEELHDKWQQAIINDGEYTGCNRKNVQNI